MSDIVANLLRSEYKKLLLPAKLRSFTGPPAGEWTAVLPIDIVYHAIDQLDPTDHVDTMKALALTCRELKAYCRPLVFETIIIGSTDLPSDENQRRAVQSLHRLSIALQRSPDIATFFKNINIRWMPCRQIFTPGDGFQRYEAEALFSFVLDRPLPELGFVSITVHGIEFPDLASCIQHSLLTVVAAPKITYVNVVMGSFPNTILERSRHARGMTLCGYIYLDPSRPQLPFTVDPHVATPSILTIAHVPDESLSLLVKEGSPRFDTSHLRILHLGHGTSDIYSARQNAIVLRAAPHLLHLTIAVTDWANTSVLFPMHKLTALVCLELDVFIVQGDELSALLTWLATSAASRSPGSLEGVEPLHIIWVNLVGIKVDDSSSQSSILDQHQTLWKAAADGSQTRWPELKYFPVAGRSSARTPEGDRRNDLGLLTRCKRPEKSEPKQPSKRPEEKGDIN